MTEDRMRRAESKKSATKEGAGTAAPPEREGCRSALSKLHAMAGNRAVGAHVEGLIQRSTGDDGSRDRHERAAERTSSEVLWRPDAASGRSAPGPGPTDDGESVRGLRNDLDQFSGGGSDGQPLPDAPREFFERRFGVDFGGVRIHADSDAASMSRAIDARAFTEGQDIYFDHGEYRPGTASGKRLLAHELAHVVQQADGTARRSIQRQANLGAAVRMNVPETTEEMRQSGYGTTYVLDGEPFHLWPAQAEAVVDFLVETAREIWSEAQAVEAGYDALYGEDSENRSATDGESGDEGGMWDAALDTAGAGLEQFAEDVTHALSDAGTPPSVRPTVRMVRSRIETAEDALNSENLDIAIGMIESAGEMHSEMAAEWNEHVRSTRETAEHIVTTLEWTRDISKGVVAGLAAATTGGLASVGLGTAAAGGMEAATGGAQQTSAQAVGLQDEYDLVGLAGDTAQAMVVEALGGLVAGPLLEPVAGRLATQFDVALRQGDEAGAWAGDVYDFMRAWSADMRGTDGVTHRMVRQDVFDVVGADETGITIALDMLQRAVETGYVQTLAGQIINGSYDWAVNGTVETDEVVARVTEGFMEQGVWKQLLVNVLEGAAR